MRRTFVLLLVILLVAGAAPDTVESDVDVVIDRVDKFLHYFRSISDTPPGFPRIDVLVKDKVGITEFFDLLGDLFANGTIGHFQDEKEDRGIYRRLYINTNKTSVALSEKLVQLFKELNLYTMFDHWVHNQLLPNDGRNDLALEAIRTAFKEIFTRSRAFYDELNGPTSAQIGLQYPFGDEGTDDDDDDDDNDEDGGEVCGNQCYMSRLDEHCSALGWTQNASAVDYTMRSFLRVVGPGCETEITDDRYLHSLQLHTYDIAKMSNFSGGESNRCFHKFLIRYHNYKKGKYEHSFVTNLAHYLTYERNIYGFCTRLIQSRDSVVPSSNPTITDQMTTLQQSLLEARCVVSEKTSPCSTGEPPAIPTWLLSDQKANSSSTLKQATRYGARKKCVPPESTTTWQVFPKPSLAKSTPRSTPASTGWVGIIPSTSPIRQEPNDTRQWAEIASNAAKQAIGNKSFEYPTSESAIETYRAVGMLMIALLKQSDGLRGLYDYKALVFFPANDETEYCIRNGTGGDIYPSMHNNVRFIIARYDRSQLGNITEKVKEAGRLCAFCEVDTKNQCDRLKMMPNTVDAALSKFRALVAIKCAKKFVWYELGYRYFQAAWTNAVAIPTSRGNDYSFKCGNTIVFP